MYQQCVPSPKEQILTTALTVHLDISVRVKVPFKPNVHGEAQVEFLDGKSWIVNLLTLVPFSRTSIVMCTVLLYNR